jgi:hypothetical protein
MNLSTTGLNLATGATIDLHLHTIYSDGRWMPEELLDHLVQEQFSLVAITDHDRTDTAIALQQLAQDKHLPVLVAVEMTASWRGEMTDLLCFGFDPAHSVLHELAQDLSRRQQENTRAVHNPGHADHRFRWMPSTCSDPCRPAVPTHGVQFFWNAGIGGRHALESVDGMLRNPEG